MPETLAKASAIFMRDMRIAFTYPAWFWGQWISIAGQVLTFYFISRLVGAAPIYGLTGHPETYFEYVAVNLAFVRFQNAAVHGFQDAMRGAQMIGTLEAVIVTPTPLPLIVLASGLFTFALTIVQVVFMLAIAQGLGLHLDRTNLLTAAIFLILTVLAMSPLGVLSAASIILFKQPAPTGILFGGIAALLSGVLFPIDRLPHALQALSWLLPITHALNGMRGAVAGASIGELWGDAVWLAVLTVALGPLSLLAFARAVRRAKSDGTLADY